MLTNNRKGLWGERIARWFLRLKGYHILKQRYKTPVGEIDIIARRGRLLIAVEVKYRLTRGAALEALQPQQLKRINKAFLYFTQQLKWVPSAYRLDLICIAPWAFPYHIENMYITDFN